MDNPDFTLFTDGSYLGGPHGKYRLCAGTSYAAASPVPILEDGPLPDISSAQEAELIALTRACHLAREIP